LADASWQSPVYRKKPLKPYFLFRFLILLSELLYRLENWNTNPETGRELAVKGLL